MHLELSGKIGGGITSKPFRTVFENMQNKFNHQKPKYQYTNDSKRGIFESVALQLAIVGKNNVYAFVIEPGFAISSQELAYSTLSNGQAFYGSTNYNYTLNIQKFDFSFINRFYIGKKHALFIDFGAYTAYESAKFMTGTVSYKWHSTMTASWGGQSDGQGTTEYNKHQLNNKGQNGLLTGIGYNFYLKNKKILYVDLRLTGHQLFGQESDELKVKDLGISVGYSFINTKSTKTKK
jgi:hypothetical protein